MRKLIVHEFMTLDGVVQAPSSPGEDTIGGFRHGGWNLRYLDDISMKWVVDSIAGAGGFVLGRRTYEIFAAHWPAAPEEEQALARPMNALPKYVASRTLTNPLPWQHATVLPGDTAEAVARLKQDEGGNLRVIGSTELVQTLVEHGLVDEFQLLIDPVVVGGGKRLFGDGGALIPLRLVASTVTSTGAILATYAT